MEEIIFKEVSIKSSDAAMLIEELNETLIGILGHNGSMHVNISDFEQPRATFIVGYYDGKPICCAGVRHVDEKTGEIKRVFARKNTIGAGAKLMKKAEQWAAGQGYSNLILECREGNPHAIEFYKKIGYQVCEKYPPYIDENDAVCMKKDI